MVWENTTHLYFPQKSRELIYPAGDLCCLLELKSSFIPAYLAVAGVGSHRMTLAYAGVRHKVFALVKSC